MIKNCLILNIVGKDDKIGLKIENNLYIKKFPNSIKNNEVLVNSITNFIKQKEINIDKNFSILVNVGPGSFSGIRISLAVAKGIKISRGCDLYGYKSSDLEEFNLKNIELLITKNLLENKLIKPLYIS